MNEPARLHDLIAEKPDPDSAARLNEANKKFVDFLFGTQRIFLGELVFAGDEALERFRTETHLFAEYISKLAGSHSVKDLRTMCQECGQHQIDFVRRDSERIFKHFDRLINTASKLVDSRPRF